MLANSAQILINFSQQSQHKMIYQPSEFKQKKKAAPAQKDVAELLRIKVPNKFKKVRGKDESARLVEDLLHLCSCEDFCKDS